MLRSGVCVCVVWAAGILDPVTQTLTNFEDEDDLNAKIDDIYAVSHVISRIAPARSVRSKARRGWVLGSLRYSVGMRTSPPHSLACRARCVRRAVTAPRRGQLGRSHV